ncbi:MAG: hypothetical protein GDA50_00200 [Alphaproteobacteria bacterium GM202ARS2]|nr:hypothetical protein [Alphaproteobacteria bacterium GM202ARS2]
MMIVHRNVVGNMGLRVTLLACVIAVMSGCVYYQAAPAPVPYTIDEGQLYLGADLTQTELATREDQRIYFDSGRFFGALTGATFGALLGSTIGSGSGNTAAIVAGATAGAWLGAEANTLSPQDHSFITTARHQALSASLHHHVRWHNRHSGYYGVIIPIKRLRVKHGYRCRQFREIIRFKKRHGGKKRLVSACRHRHSPIWYEVSVRGRL